MLKFFIVSALFLNATAALAAGDLQQDLDSTQAKAAFVPYKTLLTLGCPGNQEAASATITGGDSPFGGSQTIKFNFTGGATVSVVTSWERLIKGPGQSDTSVVIKCSLNK